jgi:hypothetical protein
MTPLEEIDAFLRKVEEQVGIEVLTFQKKIALDVFSGVVLMTPVDTGRARGGWQIGINTRVTAEGNADKSGGSTIRTGSARIGLLSDYGTIFITNNVPYITTLDQGLFVPPDSNKVVDGYSKQAPAGMVDVTLNRIASAFR